MKSICTTIVNKIRSKFRFTFTIETLEVFLKEIYTDLTKRSSSTTLEKHIFIEYMNLPIIIADKMFDLINSSADSRLTDSDFIYSLSKIYLGEMEINVNIFASLLDLNNDGYIHKSDVSLLLTLSNYKWRKELKEISDVFFNESKSLKKEEFIKRTTESNMDLFVFFMIYCLDKGPFNEEQVNYFSNNSNGKKKYEMTGNYINSNSLNNGINIGGGTFTSSLSEKLIEFISKKYDLCLGYDASEIESLGDDEHSELNELIAFENNITCVMSNIEIEVINPTKRKISLNDYLFKKKYQFVPLEIEDKSSYYTNDDTFKKGSLRIDGMGFIPGTLMQSNVQSNNQLTIKPPGLPIIKSSSSLLTFDFTNNIQMIYQDMNNTIKQCRLVLISNCLFIETEIDINSNYSDYLSSLSQAVTYEKIASFKYAYLISLSTSFIEQIGKSTLSGIEGISFYGFRVISLLNDIKKEMKFYTKNKSQLEHFMKQITKINSNSPSMLANFDIIKQIGNGEYGRVYQATDLKENKMIALKEMYNTNNSRQGVKLNWEKDILKLLSYATHPNVIRSYYHFKTQRSLFFVLEYVPNGTLNEFLNANKGNIDIYTKYSIIKQLCLGLSFLHSLKIVHCDLKPDNILLAIHSDNNKDITVKIADFGFAHILTKYQLFYESFCTLVYIGPEILQRLPYSFKVDIWSLGVIMFQILFEEIPFGKNSNDLKTIKNTILKGQFSFPENKENKPVINKVYYDIISKCLNVDSVNRPKCKEILSLIQINNKMNNE